MYTKVIAAQNKGFIAYFKRIYEFRSLIITLAYRDIKVQYAQTLLGILWSIIQPITALLIFMLFFKWIFQIDTSPIPYALFAFSGMMGWNFFSYILNHSGNSLANSQDIINRIYFPRLILPLSKILVGLVEFSLSMIVLIIMMIFIDPQISWEIIFLPVFIIFNILSGLSIGIWLSALTIRYRDFHHIIPFLINFGIWLTPVFLPANLVDNLILYHINPMAATVEGYRWTLLGGHPLSPSYFISCIPVFFLLTTGFLYFRKVESIISDYI